MVAYGPPPQALEAIPGFLARGDAHRYGPVEGLPELVDAIAQKLTHENHLPLDRSRIVVTAGGNMAFMNAVLAVAEGATEALAPLSGMPVTALEGQVAPASLESLPALALVAAAGPQDWLRALRLALSRRSGPIVPLETEAIAPERYSVERHLCIDTTAAGGNASLLAASA